MEHLTKIQLPNEKFYLKILSSSHLIPPFFYTFFTAFVGDFANPKAAPGKQKFEIVSYFSILGLIFTRRYHTCKYFKSLTLEHPVEIHFSGLFYRESFSDFTF